MHNSGQNFYSTWRESVHANLQFVTHKEIDKLVETGIIKESMSMSQIKSAAEKALGFKVQKEKR